eukprot:3403280-Pleurochrysis_carterae.AAC.1
MVAEQLGRTLHDRLRAGSHAALFASDSAAASLQARARPRRFGSIQPRGVGGGGVGGGGSRAGL